MYIPTRLSNASLPNFLHKYIIIITFVIVVIMVTVVTIVMLTVIVIEVSSQLTF